MYHNMGLLADEMSSITGSSRSLLRASDVGIEDIELDESIPEEAEVQEIKSLNIATQSEQQQLRHLLAVQISFYQIKKAAVEKIKGRKV